MFSCLVGISQKDGRVAGSMQLYSVQRKVSQSIEVSLVSAVNNTFFLMLIFNNIFFLSTGSCISIWYIHC